MNLILGYVQNVLFTHSKPGNPDAADLFLGFLFTPQSFCFSLPTINVYTVQKNSHHKTYARPW
jgi:hypothetical protein